MATVASLAVATASIRASSSTRAEYNSHLKYPAAPANNSASTGSIPKTIGRDHAIRRQADTTGDALSGTSVRDSCEAVDVAAASSLSCDVAAGSASAASASLVSAVSMSC